MLGRKIKQLLAGFSNDRFGVSLLLMSKRRGIQTFSLFGFDSLLYKQSKPQVVSVRKFSTQMGLTSRG